MSAHRLIGLLLLLALTGPGIAADLPLKPARPAQPAAPVNASPLAAPSATCQEWSDGCRVCQRAPGGEVSCSNVGIACVPKEQQCTRQ
jgi:hypothetical protein